MSLFTMQLARKGKMIEIQTRSLDDSIGSKEGMVFTPIIPAVKAIVCTPKGKRVFDGVNTEEDVTHEFSLVWPGFDVTTEHWIFLVEKNKRYRVLFAKNCCESDKRMVIECTERGLDTKAASNA